MVAARLFNERDGEGPLTIHGAVTTGTNWRFLKLESSELLVDRQEYDLEPVARILAIFIHCIGKDPAGPALDRRNGTGDVDRTARPLSQRTRERTTWA